MTEEPDVDAWRLSVEDNPGLSLADVGAALWSGKWLIAGLVAAALIGAAVYLRNARYEYTAELIVTPTQNDPGGLLGRLGSLGGLASMAGVSLPTSKTVSQFTLFEEGVQSRAAAEALSRIPWVMQGAFAKEWDATTGQWHAPHGLVPQAARALKFTLGLPDAEWRQPDAARLQRYIDKHVNLNSDTKKNTLTLSVEHEDPRFAMRFLTEMHRVIDAQLRQRTLQRATEYITYLNGRLSQITNAEQRTALVDVLNEQEKMRMMASSDVPFAAEPFGSASVSDRPTSPNFVVVLVGAAALGFLVGAAISLWRHFKRPHPMLLDNDFTTLRS